MKGVVFDENLPARLTFSPSLPIVPLKAIGISPTDTQVWEYSRQHELVIVTKDADFSDRIILPSPPPLVVHLRLGNLRRRDFHAFMETACPPVESFLRAL